MRSDIKISKKNLMKSQLDLSKTTRPTLPHISNSVMKLPGIDSALKTLNSSLDDDHSHSAMNFSSKVSRKLFGTVTIKDMSKPDRFSDAIGIKGYEMHPKLRFNFANKEYKIPKTLKNTYIDALMKDKAKIPSPDRYECNVHRLNFNDTKKKSLIYTSDR